MPWKSDRTAYTHTPRTRTWDARHQRWMIYDFRSAEHYPDERSGQLDQRHFVRKAELLPGQILSSAVYDWSALQPTGDHRRNTLSGQPPAGNMIQRSTEAVGAYLVRYIDRICNWFIHPAYPVFTLPVFITMVTFLIKSEEVSNVLASVYIIRYKISAFMLIFIPKY